MRITGHHIIRFSFQGAGKEFVVCGIVCDFVGCVFVFYDDGFSEYQAEKPPYIFFIRLKPFPNSRVMKHPVDLPDDIDGGHQDEVQIDPVILKPGGYGVITEQAAYKKVGIDDRFEFMCQWCHPACFLPL